MTSHSDAAAATDDDRAVAVTVATTADSVSDGAVATDTVIGTVDTVGTIDTVTNPDDATIATSGNAHKSSFPRTRESRTNNPAQPTEFNTVVTVGGGVATVGAAVVVGAYN